MASPSMSNHSASAEVYGPVPADRRVTGSIRVPGSKSITQRYFTLSLLGRRALTIRGPLLSEDTRFFLAAMETLGFRVQIEGSSSADVTVHLEPPEGDPPSEGEIWCGAGGTMFRFRTAALTAVPGLWTIDGIPRLRERPVAPLISSLRALGAKIDCLDQEGHAPMRIHGGSLRGGPCTLDAGASSQYLSALLMAGLVTPEPTTVTVSSLTSEPYVHLTLDAIQELGGKVEQDGPVYGIRRARPTGDTVTVESDFSAVAYPAAAAALTRGEVLIRDVRETSRQGDRGFVDVLARMGADIRWTDEGLRIRGGGLRAIEADLESMPDQVPTLAALAPFARGTTRIVNVPNLRIKESDRLAAMAQELQRVGAEVEELEDGLVIPGVWADRTPPNGAVTVHTHGDHRIAMAMALVGLRRGGISVAAPEVVAKSYPEFWQDLEGIIRP